MFNLRFVYGTRDGEPAPDNDALMFTVPVEFPNDTGTVHHYQVGVKYSPGKPLGRSGDVSLASRTNLRANMWSTRSSSLLLP